MKTCSYDCVYCQLGKSKETTIERRPYVLAQDIVAQVSEKLKQGVRADYITLGGSGEPTLNDQIGSLIHHLRKLSNIPVAVLTNSSLLGDKWVRQSIIEADVVLPSLDAHDPGGFQAINRPHPAIRFDAMVEGLIAFRKEFTGEIWLEILILDGVNASQRDAHQFKQWVKKIQPEKVHVNTAVRPPAEAFARQVSPEQMSGFCTILGDNAEAVASFRGSQRHEGAPNVEADLLNLLARRPCTLDDIASGLRVQKDEILRLIDPLVKNQSIQMVKMGPEVYYQCCQDEQE
jgi:wyosine [tRNA(Phe)-imidazoG37] synthetase (radical SAM superfamily)